MRDVLVQPLHGAVGRQLSREVVMARLERRRRIAVPGNLTPGIAHPREHRGAAYRDVRERTTALPRRWPEQRSRPVERASQQETPEWKNWQQVATVLSAVKPEQDGGCQEHQEQTYPGIGRPDEQREHEGQMQRRDDRDVVA